jgi:hypothetical protein
MANDRSWPNSAVAVRPLSLVTRDGHKSVSESGRCTVKNDPSETVTSDRFRASDGFAQFVRVNVTGTRTRSRSRVLSS